MDISKEPIGKLNEVIKIRLRPDDYRPQLDQSVRKTRKQVAMPGFRQGHVPEGLVRKKYGKALLVEELNKIVSESLDNYIKESNLDILGQPLPYRDGEHSNNFDTPGDFEFNFELGLSPQFELKLPPSHVFPFYVIEVKPETVEQRVTAIQKRFGEYTHPEVSDAQSFLQVALAEVGPDDQPVDKGIRTTNTMLVEKAVDEASRAALTGLAKEETVVLDIRQAFDAKEGAYLLGIPEERLAGLTNRFAVTVKEINNVKPAALDQALFDKVYGEGTVTTEAAFRDKVTEEIAGMYRTESERKLAHDIEDELLRATGIELPDAFLKRWLQEANEKEVTAEAVEKEYDRYARGMKWKLIERRIVNENGITVTPEEIESYARHYMVHQLSQYGGSYLTEELVGQMTANYLAKEENKRKSHEALVERKVFEHLLGLVKRKEVPIDYEGFTQVLREHVHAH